MYLFHGSRGGMSARAAEFEYRPSSCSTVLCEWATNSCQQKQTETPRFGSKMCIYFQGHAFHSRMILMQIKRFLTHIFGSSFELSRYDCSAALHCTSCLKRNNIIEAGVKKDWEKIVQIRKKQTNISAIVFVWWKSSNLVWKVTRGFLSCLRVLLMVDASFWKVDMNRRESPPTPTLESGR